MGMPIHNMGREKDSTYSVGIHETYEMIG